MITVLKYFRPHTFSILAIFALLFGQVMADLALPAYMADIINDGVLTGSNAVVLSKGIQMLILSLVSASCTVAAGFLSARMATKVSKTVRGDVFKRVTDFSNSEFDEFSTASLVTRSTNDIQQLQMVSIMFFRMVLFAPIMGIGALIRAYATSATLSWTIAVAIILVAIMMIILFSVTMPKSRRIQKLVDKLNLITNERLSGLLVIRAFRKEEYEEERFDKENVKLMSLSRFVNRAMSLAMPLMMLIMNGISILIIYVATPLIAQASLNVGDMMAFLQYAMQVIMSFLMISMIFVMLPRALVSIQRIADVLVTDISIVDPESPVTIPDSTSVTVEFKHVNFCYPDADTNVLTDIDFTANPGETTAFIGGTGSGKSTIVNLLPRFYDTTKGEILFNGVDIKNATQNEVRSLLGFVPQRAVLFSGTIGSNLRYGRREASDEELMHAAEIAQADDFIKANPDGLDAPIAQGGTNVSGGQKQRLSIARALAKKPPIYVFDDSFSALDFKTDRALRGAMHEDKDIQNATVFIVAQRINTIKNADQIIVLDEGKIVGKGTHSELMSTCEVYREIALSQLSEEELA